MRVTARFWPVAAVLAAVVWTTTAVAAPPGAGRGAAAPPAAGGARPGDIEARRRDEIDALQRQDAAEALKNHFNISVDWRTTPLAKLIDIRVRAAKAAELQARLGVSVEWQRYSWIELEALRRTLLSFEQYRGDQPEPAPGPRTAVTAAPPRNALPAASTDELVQPTFKGRTVAPAGRAADPDGVIRPTFTGRAGAPIAPRDPDGVIRPTFAARPRWSSAEADPDGLIAPTFVPARRAASVGDADDLIDPAQPTESRTRRVRW